MAKEVPFEGTARILNAPGMPEIKVRVEVQGIAVVTKRKNPEEDQDGEKPRTIEGQDTSEA